MYAAVLPTPPKISLKPCRIAMANNNNSQSKFLRLDTRSPLPPTLCFVDGGFGRRDRYGLVHRSLSSAPSPMPCMSLAVASYGSCGALTLERPKVEIAAPVKTAAAVLDNDGGDIGGGEDDGGIGGGDGGEKPGPFGDDDDFWFEDGEDLGFFGRRRMVPELFDRRTTNAVLSEWMRTIKDLPLGLKEALGMGILSSADLTKFLFFNLRPTIARLLAHRLPQKLITDFNGKIMADPALPYKLLLEASLSVGWSVWLDTDEYRQNEGLRMKKDWNLVLTNAMKNAACNVFVVWSLAPANGLINWPKVPKNVNSVFERSQRIKKFDMEKRVLSFFHKGVAFFAVGFTAKAAAQIISLEKKMMSVGDLARLSNEALAAGVFMGLITNLRYQLIWGMDRSLDLYFDVPKASLGVCSALRFVNVGIGTRSLNWVWSEDGQLINASAVPRIGLKDAIANVFGLVDSSTKKKRVIRKKVGS